ncbi:hypothetical protein E6C70_09265 [Glaciibacter flavus]|uniref:Uncharacterized protein n=1 Tax=Orlajensenia flava TaxID=2565934 RepID=A0A4S4FVB8_9MICO|nr:hypothetical protein [Glaciibacter flavus]THG34444.1 hypothetical protein E6C70_09265 [Glaciibacter flavus]
MTTFISPDASNGRTRRIRGLWLAFAGWTIVPVLIVLVTNSWGQPSIADIERMHLAASIAASIAAVSFVVSAGLVASLASTGPHGRR